jgi:meso-butanediol dehydrogenase/(S,S)-butanediol dehydrogenase/diacetyl reductase
MNELRAKRALISGGASGIGLAIAEALAAQGVELILVSRRQALLEQEAARLSARYGVRALPLALDLCDSAQVRARQATGRPSPRNPTRGRRATNSVSRVPSAPRATTRDRT